MTSPLCQAPAIHLEEGVNLVPDLLCTLVLVLALAQAAGTTATIMLNNMIASQAQPPSVGIPTPSVSVLCNQILDSMALLGGFSVQYYVSSSVRT
jgi:hypothetical protein